MITSCRNYEISVRLLPVTILCFPWSGKVQTTGAAVCSADISGNDAEM
jgi:hypothetical protein